jgi:hypothetical protein
MQTLQCEAPMIRWQAMSMPDANAPVRLARLISMKPDHFWAVVAFPPGWQRVRSGHYSVDEDFLLLQGDLTINRVSWHAQEHGFIPANTLREQTESIHGCVACARFHGRPQWHTGSAGMMPQGKVQHSPDWRSIGPVDLQGNGWGHLVLEHGGMVYAVLPQATLETLRASGELFDALDLTSRPGSNNIVVAEGQEPHFIWTFWPSQH